MSALKYWIWLTQLTGVQPQLRLALLHRLGSPEQVFFADEQELLLTEGMTREQLDRMSDHSLDTAQRILADCQRLQVDLIT